MNEFKQLELSHRQKPVLDLKVTEIKVKVICKKRNFAK